MGKVKYSEGIDYVQGSLAKPKVKEGHRCGSYLIGTHRTAATTSSDCTRLYVRGADTYVRTTPPSADELAVRERFASVAHMVSVRKKDLSKINADTAAFLAQKDQPGGKQTMLSWYWMVCGAEYDESQG